MKVGCSGGGCEEKTLQPFPEALEGIFQQHKLLPGELQGQAAGLWPRITPREGLEGAGEQDPGSGSPSSAALAPIAGNSGLGH